MATGNPALSEKYFAEEAHSATRGDVMTVQGAAIKTALLTTIVVAVGAVTWGMVFPSGLATGSQALEINRNAMMLALLGGGLGGFVLCLVICFVPKTAPVLSPVYAVCEGAFLGAISGIYAQGAYPAIVLQAVMLTVGVLVAMLTIYATRIIVVTDKLRAGIIAATMGVLLASLAVFVLNMFGVRVPYIYDAGPIGIGISAVVIVLAALNLVLDFDTIENGARMGAPKYMEWFGAFGLIVTLVWLYTRILHLLWQLNGSRD